jgi:hypothetical protein
MKVLSCRNLFFFSPMKLFFWTFRTFITQLTVPNRWSPIPQRHEEPLPSVIASTWEITAIRSKSMCGTITITLTNGNSTWHEISSNEMLDLRDHYTRGG